MSKLSMTERFNAPVDRVFEVFADLPHAAERIAGITNIEMLTDGPVGVGTRWRETRVVMKKESTEEMEIVSFDRPRSYAVTSNSCGCIFDWKIAFESDPAGGTAVTMSLDSKPQTLMAKISSPILGLMMGPMFRKCMTADMNDLRQVIEGSAATPA